MVRRPFGPVGIIDIGSNSVRFVVYSGSPRVPSAVFNEKVMAALGRGLSEDGRLRPDAMERTLEALARFRLLSREIGVKRLHTVATAAVRDAANGKDFLKRVTALGLKPRLLGGGEEAELAALGVISGIPNAHGVAADLGGGSLELIGVVRGAAGAGVSLPLGVLRKEARGPAAELVDRMRLAAGNGRLLQAGQGHGLYLVGGSFRAIAQLDLRLSGHALPIVHQHRITPDRVKELAEIVRSAGVDKLRAWGVSEARVATLGTAATILEAMTMLFRPARVLLSAFGLREGLLYRDLDPATQHEDPLLAAALDIANRLGRFGDHGAMLDEWIAPIFHDQPRHVRLRLAACLLADIAWDAHPDFRAERAIDMAVYGNWVGIDAHGRALLGRALSSAFGGNGSFDPRLEELLEPGERDRAEAWGRAIRLAQRLAGGTGGLLRRTSLSQTGTDLVLTIPKAHGEIYADTVAKRLKQLAQAVGREAKVRLK